MYATTVIGILYTIYVLFVLTFMGWFGYSLTHDRKINLKIKIGLTAWILFLSVVAVTFHVVTYLKLPWVKWEIMSKTIKPRKEFKINVSDYNFHLPETPMVVKVNDPVKFIVTSEDVTYGFGVFREDGTLVFQMQVVPARENEIIWIFQKMGRYTIRSTEYSGPENWKMVLKDAVIVQE